MTAVSERRLGAVLARGAQIVQAAGVTEPIREAEAIIASVLGVAPQDLGARESTILAEEALRCAIERLRRRARREPLEYITGQCTFRGLELHVDPRVLVPRATSEPLVELACSLAPRARVHDVGTGCGAIALAIKNERPDLHVSASDISKAAIAVAEMNRGRLGLDVAFTVAAGLPPAPYDLVVANLPSRDDAGQLTEYPEPELADHQPRIAVFAGETDLGLLEGLVSAAPRDLCLALEHTTSQTARVRALFRDPTTLQDLNGCDRVTTGRPAVRT
jgi:release factor glutamine methyltransferase